MGICGHQLERIVCLQSLPSENLDYLNEKLDMVDSSEIHDSDDLTILDLQQNDRIVHSLKWTFN